MSQYFPKPYEPFGGGINVKVDLSSCATKADIENISHCENIYSVNPLYLLISHANWYIEQKGVNKYLIFDSTDENKELLKKYNDV